MKLKRFTKNQKQKGIVIGSIVGILLLIGGITLYRTFALYKVEASFDVLKGTVPDFSSGDVTLAVKIDGTPTQTMPNIQDNTYAIKVSCDNGKGAWNVDTWGVEISNIDKVKVKCNIDFSTLKVNETFEFNYTGEEQSISLPKGKYKLEVWGAQGGGTQAGGYGGYSKGELSLNTSDTLYINVGGQGEGPKTSGISYGGYNGGGNGNNTGQKGTGGGGATHIATVKGLLSTLGNQTSTILIVAGGGGGNGGGGNPGALGGNGGGLNGTNGTNSVSGTYQKAYLGSGATQSVGGKNITWQFTNNSTQSTWGTFGKGGNNYNDVDDGCDKTQGCGGSGGGGGYYGGGGSARGHAGAGGGSGFVNSLLNNASTTTSTRTGNGSAKITYLGNA